MISSFTSSHLFDSRTGLLVLLSSVIIELSVCQNESLTYFIAANQYRRNNDQIVGSTNLGDSIVSIDDKYFPSDCAGNRFEAIEVGRQCSKKCKPEVACENTRKQCLCDGLCGMSCIRPDMTCPEIESPKDGCIVSSNLSLDTPTNVFGSKVTFECNENFFMFGSRSRTCLGDEEWSGVRVECFPEPSCKSPPKVNHAKNPNQIQVYRLNDKVTYSCYLGYEPMGSNEAECRFVDGRMNQTAWTWEGPKFRCIPKSCQEPPRIENANKLGDSNIVASSILYTCNEGYEMIGQSKRYCQSDGQWSGKAPQCEPVTCNPTDHLDNGRIDYAYPLIHNSSVEYSCDHGFKLVGASTRKCGLEKKLLGEIPRCEEIDCGPQGPLRNGYVKGFSSRMGDKKEFICLDGMKFVGSSRESVCQENGLWSHQLPQCLAPCSVPHVEHSLAIVVMDNDESALEAKYLRGETLDKVDAGSMVAHDTSVNILCKKDYELDDNYDEQSVSNLPRCVDGLWTYEPRCRFASCKLIPRGPKNGRLTMFSTEHGSRATILCLDGYALAAGAVDYIECVKGNWTASGAKCVEAYCPNPGQIENGNVQISGQNGMYDMKPYITRIAQNKQIGFECNSGYVMKEGFANAATCLNGKWKPEGMPSCIPEVLR